MITLGWIWIILAAVSAIFNVYGASKGGATKSAGGCALDAVTQALLAVWIYFVIIYI